MRLASDVYYLWYIQYSHNFLCTEAMHAIAHCYVAMATYYSIPQCKVLIDNYVHDYTVVTK